ncbi:MAG: peptidoglycan editing factor PgeF [Thiolinea sp.]
MKRGDKVWLQNARDRGWVIPDWPAPEGINAVCTTRCGGVSTAPFDSLNLGDHVADAPEAVVENRRILREALQLPAEPLWLEQVHGTDVHCIDGSAVQIEGANRDIPSADASAVFIENQIAVVMTADCLPVLFCDQAGTRVAAAHAGWRGLCNGVLEQTVTQLACEPENLMAWLGPAIGPEVFEVGAEVREAFIQHDAQASQAFKAGVEESKFLADIYLLARQRLQAIGINQIYGGNFCTLTDSDRFFSYRREARTGRMASLIWM